MIDRIFQNTETKAISSSKCRYLLALTLWETLTLHFNYFPAHAALRVRWQRGPAVRGPPAVLPVREGPPSALLLCGPPGAAPGGLRRRGRRKVRQDHDGVPGLLDGKGKYVHLPGNERIHKSFLGNVCLLMSICFQQIRSSLAKGRRDEFLEDLLKWCKEKKVFF